MSTATRPAPTKGSTPTPAQTRRIAAPSSREEREADRIADAVIRGTWNTSPPPVSSTSGARIYRQCTACNASGELGADRDGVQIFLKRGSDSSNPPTRAAAAKAASAVSGGGEPLPDAVRSYFEPRFGADLSAVRVHTDAAAGTAPTVTVAAKMPRPRQPQQRSVVKKRIATNGDRDGRVATESTAVDRPQFDFGQISITAPPSEPRPDLKVQSDATRSNAMPARLRAGLEALSGLELAAVRVHTRSSEPARLNALAFARGLDIHLAPGQEAHLPHEGWHVVQQMQGRVRPSASTAHALVNNDLALEQEADHMGAKALLIGRAGSVRPSLAMPHPVAAGPIQLRPKNKKKAEAAAAEAASVEAQWFADELFNAPLDQIGPMLDGIAEDARALSATLDAIDRFAPGAEGSREERHRHSMIHIGLINRLDALEQSEQAVAGFEEAVYSALKESGRGLVAGGEPQKQMVAILDSAGTKTLKKIERMLLLWPRAGKAPTKRDIINLVTSRSRQSATEESRRGRFDLAAGESAAQGLRDQVPVLVEEEKARVAKLNEKEIAKNQRRVAQGLDELELTKANFNKCLKLLSTVESRSQLHPGEEDASLRARIRYERGVKERASGLHSKGTLSRYAQELRLEGLVGPVTIVQAAQGPDLKHVPAMTDLFDKLSDAGDGWYFFYVSVVSLHTVFVGVRSEGGSRSYFLIQMPPTNMDARTKDKLEEFFDGWSHKGASSRVWQIYAHKAD